MNESSESPSTGEGHPPAGLELARVLRHRTRNDLQVIQSLLRLQGRRAANASTARVLDANVRRVRVIALAYEHLNPSSSSFRVPMRRYLERLIAEERPRPTGAGIECNVSPDLCLPLSLAVPCGLIVAELLSSRIEQASPDDGPVAVRLEKTGDPCRLTVRGGREPKAAPSSDSFSVELVRLLVSQLGGEMVDNSVAGRGSETEILFRCDENDRP